MRTVKFTTRFKKDYKRELKGTHKATLDADYKIVRDLLASDTPLAASYVDHDLKGNWKNHRDCHIKPDLVLIYRLPDKATLKMVRIGSHSELGI